MADVYSLVCWGGITGKPVTLTIANPCVVTSTAHGLRDGTGLVLSTTGALPTGLVAGTTYYAKSTAANTFNLYDTAANAIAGGTTGRITTTGTQSGTHTAKSKLMGDLFTAHSGRWGDAGSERCFDGVNSFLSGRASASPLDAETCEIGEAFTETGPSVYQIYTSLPSAATTITTRVDGEFSQAFHNGVLGSGFIFLLKSNFGFYLNSYNNTFSGFTVKTSGGATPYNAITSVAVGGLVDKMIFWGDGTGNGPAMRGALTYQNCLVIGFTTGMMILQYEKGVRAYNCTITKNTYGFRDQYGATANIYGFYYNNIVVGNTTANWFAMPATVEGASGNAALSGEAWVKGSGTALTIATTDFLDFTNNDFRPASSSSPQVDTGTAYYNINSYDIANNERPNYNNGGAESVDVGAYEFDHGYGIHPASCALTLTNVAVGSRVHIERQDNGTVYFDDVAASSTVTTSLTVGAGADNNIRIKIRKASSGTSYQPFETLATLAAGSMSIYVSQQPDE